jgi:hypothetical protein
VHNSSKLLVASSTLRILGYTDLGLGVWMNSCVAQCSFFARVQKFTKHDHEFLFFLYYGWNIMKQNHTVWGIGGQSWFGEAWRLCALAAHLISSILTQSRMVSRGRKGLELAIIPHLVTWLEAFRNFSQDSGVSLARHRHL